MTSDPAAFERMAPVCELESQYPRKVTGPLAHVFAEINADDWRPHLREVLAPTPSVHGEDDLDPVEEAQEWGRGPARPRSSGCTASCSSGTERPTLLGAVNRFLGGESI